MKARTWKEHGEWNKEEKECREKMALCGDETQQERLACEELSEPEELVLTTHTQRLVREQLRMNKSHKSEINSPELLGSAVCGHERANPTVAVSKTE